MNQQFKELFEKLTALGYVEQPAQELTDYFNQQRVLDPSNRKRQGKQVSFRFAFDTRSVIVWTTYSPTIDGPKEGYNGWVIIPDSINPENEPLLFSFPVIKTDSFFEILYGYAAAFKELLEKWPKCPQCTEELLLVRVKGHMSKRVFVCKRPNNQLRHRLPRPNMCVSKLPFLSKDNQDFLYQKFYQESLRLIIKNKEEGKVTLPKRVVRAQKAREAKQKASE